MENQYPIIDKVQTGKQIRRLMNSNSLTVADVQEYLGFSTQQAVYHWLNGRSLPTLDNIYALSELFMVPMDQIICGSRKYQPDYGVKYHRIQAYIDFMQVNDPRLKSRACKNKKTSPLLTSLSAKNTTLKMS